MEIVKIFTKVYEDIKAIRIQGATNVAIASTLGAKLVYLWAKNKAKNEDAANKLALATLYLLATARPTEPLAQNAFVFAYYSLKQQKKVIEAADTYLNLINEAKHSIVRQTTFFPNFSVVLTHCHSSTVEKLLVSLNRKNKLQVVTTETRPLYQGRITAKNLISQNIDTYMIVDDAVARFILDDSYLPVDAVFIGADAVDQEGNVINKVGSLGIALASFLAKKPLYVVTPALKLSTKPSFAIPAIEERSATEVWENAPEKLKIINTAFDPVPANLINFIVSELGILSPKKFVKKTREAYKWIHYAKEAFSNIPLLLKELNRFSEFRKIYRYAQKGLDTIR